MSYRILLVEDEEHLLEAIKLNLELEGYSVTTANDGRKAIKLFKQERFNLIILDVMLPELDGFRVCEIIKLENKEVPILFLTANNTSESRVLGLKRGADDYLAKPFNLEELLLRIQILIKRSLKPGDARESKSEIYKFGSNEVNFATYEIIGVKRKKIQLTKREVMLLKLLIDRKQEVVSRELILETVWGYDVYPSTRTIDNFILNFRKYFEKDPKHPQHFFSVRGVGYKFIES